MSVKAWTPEQCTCAEIIWTAGFQALDRYQRSGMIPPSDTYPEAEIWSAMIREILVMLDGDRHPVVAQWDYWTLEERYRSLEDCSLGYDAFVNAWNAWTMRRTIAAINALTQ